MDVPKAFNWVKARSLCSLETLFVQLAEVVESDVRAMREQPRQGIAYEHRRTIDTKFIVTRTEAGIGFNTVTAVVFDRGHNSITVETRDSNGNPKKLFSATPRLEPNGECKLIVDGESMELWQVSRKALEDFFFRD